MLHISYSLGLDFVSVGCAVELVREAGLPNFSKKMNIQTEHDPPQKNLQTLAFGVLEVEVISEMKYKPAFHRNIYRICGIPHSAHKNPSQI